MTITKILAAMAVSAALLAAVTAGSADKKPASRKSVLSQITVEGITDTQAKIYWLSDIPGGSYVEYGPKAGEYRHRSKVDKLPRVAHLIVLTGLKRNTPYHYRVCVKDIFDKLHKSSDYTFTTLKDAPMPGKTYYVSPSGNDRNSGLSTKTAWKTLSHAADTVKAGDTVRILPGNYEGFIIKTGGADVNPITFEGYKGKPLIAGSGIFFKKRVSYVNLANLRVTSKKGKVGIEAEYGHHINIWNCEVFNTGSVGIYIGDAQYVAIDNCDIHHNGWNSVMIGVHGKGPKDSYHISITNCKIHANRKHGLIDITVHFGNKFSHHHVDIINNQLYDGWHSDAFYTHWDVKPVLRVFNLSGNDVHHCNYYELQLAALKDSYLYKNKVHNSKQNCIRSGKTAQWSDLDNITLVENEADKVLKMVADGHLFVRNRIKYIQVRGKNVVIRDHDKETFQVDAGDSLVTVEYTDGRTFSVNGKGRYRTYRCAKGIYTITVGKQNEKK